MQQQLQEEQSTDMNNKTKRATPTSNSSTNRQKTLHEQMAGCEMDGMHFDVSFEMTD